VSRFEGVIGHRRVLELLERELARPAAAYLFVGASEAGKGTVARRFAAALLCPGPHDDGCRSCRRALAGSHPDLAVVEAEGRQSLGVDQARTVVARAVLAPVESARKVFLLEEAGTMTEAAANALLKTLEEPTVTTVFLLVAESEDELPATVASRCRTVHFGRVDEGELAAALVERGVDRDRAATLASVSGGRPGLALSLLASPEVAGFRAAWLEVPRRVSDRPGEAFLLAQEMLARVEPVLPAPLPAIALGKEQVDRDQRRARQALLTTGLEILASFYVDAASIQLGGAVRNGDLALADLTRIPPAKAVANAERVLETVVDLAANLRPQLALADLFVDLAGE
jgi:DNA polymerase-3 subunit delta'